MSMNVDFVNSFLSFIDKLKEAEGSRAGWSVGYDEGRKYVRVWKAHKPDSVGYDGRYAFCFVDKSNGDVLKCDGWKKPAKHARGNIYSPSNGMEGVSLYGANYL